LIRINLSPEREKGRQTDVRVQILIYILSLTVVLAGCFFTYSQKASQIKGLERRMYAKQKELSKYGEVEAKLKEMKAKEKELKEKESIVKQIVARRTVAIRALDALSNTLVPGKIWITTAKNNSSTLTITGYGQDNQTIAQYMKNLESSPVFTDVDLMLSEESSVKDYIIELDKILVTDFKDQLYKESRAVAELREGISKYKSARTTTKSTSGGDQKREYEKLKEKRLGEYKLKKFTITMRLVP
jgi:type IV pilus assembly protein PilN